MKTRKLVHDTVIRNNLEALRQKSTINALELKTLVIGRNIMQRERVLRFLAHEPECKNWPSHFDSIDEYHRRVAMVIKKLGKEFKTTYEEYKADPLYALTLCDGLEPFDVSLSIKIGVHFNLYIKTLLNLGTSRHQHFINSALAFEDLGCFALTELGHGSNVKGMQTEAHFDINSREFIINTPNDLAMKFWIGGAGKTANMCVVWANLYIAKKNYGLHAFVVPIRNKEDHTVLPGIVIGDCGPKYGMNGIDNGFLIFKNVRIPRENLLNKFSGVSETGEFTTVIKNPDKRFGIALGSLSAGRLAIAVGSVTMIRNVIAIGVRFSAMRLQFSGLNDGPEHSILDYPVTQFRLFTYLASAFAYGFANEKVTELWVSLQAGMLDKKNQALPEFHALSSAVKVFTTICSKKATAEVRQLCGGLGYSSYARLGRLIADSDISATFEGDNNVLIQQTTKYLMDSYRKLMTGKPLDKSVAFLTTDLESIAKCPEDLFTVPGLMKALEFAANAYVASTAREFQEILGKLNGDMYNAWLKLQVFHQMAPANAYLCVYAGSAFAETLGTVGDKSTRAVLQKFFEMWALGSILELMPIYAEHNYFTGEQIRKMKERITALCGELKDEAVGVIDAVSDPDRIIGSPLGAYDGDMYNKLIQKLWNAPAAFSKPNWWKEAVTWPNEADFKPLPIQPMAGRE